MSNKIKNECKDLLGQLERAKHYAYDAMEKELRGSPQWLAVRSKMNRVFDDIASVIKSIMSGRK